MTAQRQRKTRKKAQLTPWVELQRQEQRVLDALADNDGWAGAVTITNQAGISDALTTKRIYRQLVDKGWLKFDHNGRVSITTDGVGLFVSDE